MIKSFKHKGLELFYRTDSKKFLDAKDIPKITRILDRLDSASDINDMNIPGWDLHELKGKRKHIWSVAVRKNWKITFRLIKGDAYHINLEDYH